MKKVLIYIIVFICIFVVSGSVFAQIKKTNDQLCYDQVGPSRYHKWSDSLGGGASCDCLDGYEWDIATLHCLKKETNLTEKQNQTLEKAREHILELQKAKILEQIDELKKTNTIEQFAKIAEEERKEESQKIGWIIFGFLIALYLGITLYSYTRLKNIEERRRIREIKKKRREEEREVKRIQQEEEVRIKREEEILRLKQREEEARQEKEIRMDEYQKLREEIEAMPKYANWKNAVFSKTGMVCEMCGGTNNLEIHHRQSFYSIIQAYQIKNVVQAFETNALWEIDNGSVLCKTCHNKTASSKYCEQNNL